MDMAARFPEQRLFFSTGRRLGEGVEPIVGLGLRPAVLAHYRDLTRLRYDYPVVMVSAGPAAGTVRALSGIVDELLQDVAPRGIEGERLRKHVLRLEREIRVLLLEGASGTLSELWAKAAARISPADDATVADVLRRTGAELVHDGALADCDESLAPRLLAHQWKAAQDTKGRAFRATVERLVVRLTDILRAAHIHSESGQRPEALQAAIGSTHRDQFDFEAMSRLVGRHAPKDELPAPRRHRIEWALEVLAEQPFHPDPRRPAGAQGAEPFEFRFDNCAAATEAFRERLPQLAQVVKAIAIAELEVDGLYIDARHDPFFDSFDEHALSAEDLALFPDYLVCIPEDRNNAPENAGLMDMLSSGLPVKVLVVTGDLLEESSIGTGHFAFGVRSIRLANTATSLGGVFVIQSTSSNLYSLRKDLEKAFAHRGAALFSIYAGSGAAAAAGKLPHYLAAAAAMESRAFPAFSYDPYAGDNIAARFSLVNNPQAEADWPVLSLDYADEHQQRITEEAAFTFADFVLCDRRYAEHFARVPRNHWNASMVPADEWLARDPKMVGDAIPYILAVGADNVLQRVIVDAKLMQAANRSRTFWHRLQEQGGINNSHAEILLARERAKWEQLRQQEIEQLRAPAGGASLSQPVATTLAAAALAAIAPEPPPPERSTDEAWIETARCPSCNECQQINNRLFKYDENNQAYIADISAGTYRDLVEAAEVCQVAIIHPGKPRNPSEPGLEELIERAKPFM